MSQPRGEKIPVGRGENNREMQRSLLSFQKNIYEVSFWNSRWMLTEMTDLFLITLVLPQAISRIFTFIVVTFHAVER